MTNELLYAVVGSGAVGALLSFVMSYGASRNASQELTRRINLVENELKTVADTYVTYRHFNEIMHGIRESQRELRADVKKILDVLATRL